MLDLHSKCSFANILEYDEELFKQKTNIEDLFIIIKKFKHDINNELQNILNLLMSCDYYS